LQVGTKMRSEFMSMWIYLSVIFHRLGKTLCLGLKKRLTQWIPPL
jgi:hypothetical protein